MTTYIVYDIVKTSRKPNGFGFKFPERDPSGISTGKMICEEKLNLLMKPCMNRSPLYDIIMYFETLAYTMHETVPRIFGLLVIYITY